MPKMFKGNIKEEYTSILSNAETSSWGTIKTNCSNIYFTFIISLDGEFYVFASKNLF